MPAAIGTAIATRLRTIESCVRSFIESAGPARGASSVAAAATERTPPRGAEPLPRREPAGGGGARAARQERPDGPPVVRERAARGAEREPPERRARTVLRPHVELVREQQLAVRHPPQRLHEAPPRDRVRQL